MRPKVRPIPVGKLREHILKARLFFRRKRDEVTLTVGELVTIGASVAIGAFVVTEGVLVGVEGRTGDSVTGVEASTGDSVVGIFTGAVVTGSNEEDDGSADGGMVGDGVTRG